MRQEPFVTIYGRVGLDAGAVLKQLCADYQTKLSKLLDGIFREQRDELIALVDKAFADHPWVVAQAAEARTERAPATRKPKRIGRARAVARKRGRK